ncbi:unnamed protein product [Plutella xylostella]|uniref:(diamondback moth) hypothetical protein n=1 Tax=Plutella xylostella TaxID=51655 RepID=A0A8S4FRT4_PLUXY|nr:unnamed protein product [Plutella xylostella]
MSQKKSKLHLFKLQVTCPVDIYKNRAAFPLRVCVLCVHTHAHSAAAYRRAGAEDKLVEPNTSKLVLRELSGPVSSSHPVHAAIMTSCNCLANSAFKCLIRCHIVAVEVCRCVGCWRRTHRAGLV